MDNTIILEEWNLLNIKGQDLVSKKKFRAALKYYDKALELDKDNPLVLSNKAVALANLNKYPQSIKIHKHVLKLDPDNVQSLHGVGAAYDNYYNKLDKALEYFLKALSIDPNYKKSLFSAGKVLTNMGQYIDGLRYYDKVEKIDKSYEGLYYNKGNALYRLGNYPQAINYFDKELVNHPKDKSTLINKGHALRKMGLFNNAMECFDKVLSLDKNSLKAMELKYDLLVYMKKYDLAIEYMDKCISLKPTEAENYVKKAIIRREQGLINESIEDIKLALKLADPEGAVTNAKSQVSTTYLEKHGGELIRILMILGELYDKIQNCEEQEECYKKILFIDPENEEATFEMARVLRNKGEHEEANEYFLKADAIYNERSRAHKKLDILDEEKAMIIKYCRKKKKENDNWDDLIASLFTNKDHQVMAKYLMEEYTQTNNGG